MFAICLASAAACSGEDSIRIIEEQMERIARRDQEALGMLYQRTKSAVYGFVLSILKNTQDAEDVLQDTYIQIYTAADTYLAKGKPMAWILTIARNQAMMKLRDRKKTADIPQEDWENCLAENPGLSHEDRLVLQTVLGTLSGEELQIVMLHAAAGFRHREIASLLSLPLSTVLSKYNRAMKKLRVKLTEGE
ncbi:RNA polymerase sigma factor [Bacilliculturomica massiliensis]|uniref:RNA polymerase sigma factor n=1 Tax=Bacilliculturomica massiliensis TaxID=1917867 RepID=UPI00102FBDC0|nr:RNA polymerase sigma factor [Bacilliculturomica massiliensis]